MLEHAKNKYFFSGRSTETKQCSGHCRVLMAYVRLVKRVAQSYQEQCSPGLIEACGWSPNVCDRRRHMASLRPGFHYSPVAHFLPEVSKDYLKLLKNLWPLHMMLCSFKHSCRSHFLLDPSPIIALPCPWVSYSVLLFNFALIVGFVKVIAWISINCFIGFVKIDTQISLTYYIVLSKLIHGYL